MTDEGAIFIWLLEGGGLSYMYTMVAGEMCGDGWEDSECERERERDINPLNQLLTFFCIEFL